MAWRKVGSESHGPGSRAKLSVYSPSSVTCCVLYRLRSARSAWWTGLCSASLYRSMRAMSMAFCKIDGAAADRKAFFIRTGEQAMG